MATNPDYLNLSVAERIQLVEDIWDSIARDAGEDYPLAAAQLAEVQRRLAEHDADPSSSVPWAALREKMLNKA